MDLLPYAVGLSVALFSAGMVRRHWPIPRSDRDRTVPPNPLVDPTDNLQESCVPLVKARSIDADAVLGGKPEWWVSFLQAMAPSLPVHIHCTPRPLYGPNAPPIFSRVVDALMQHPETHKLLMDPKTGLPTKTARLKLRLSGHGKFIHRNRYPRRQLLIVLSGEMEWLFVNSQGNDGAADKYLDATENDNWNGFRSQAHPSMLSSAEMRKIQAELPSTVESKIQKVGPGDLLIFDGQWWHGTSYETPVLMAFFTPGKDCEVAVSEQKRRKKLLEKQMMKGLELCTMSMAKVSQLGDSWASGYNSKAQIFDGCISEVRK